MLQVTNVSLQYGSKKLFEDVNIKFTKGNCYGIIGANGAGKSTFLKVLSGEIEPNKGDVTMDKNERMSVLMQNQNAYDDQTVVRTVMLGHKRLVEVMDEREAIYAKEGYIRKYLKEPTVQEIADEIGIAKEDVVYALDAIQMPVSLHEPVYSDGGDTLYVMDQVSDKKNKEDNWVEELSLEAAMERLNERERYIISLRFFEGKTQMEVADEIGISQAQVSRLEKNALKVMKKYLLGD